MRNVSVIFIFIVSLILSVLSLDWASFILNIIISIFLLLITKEKNILHLMFGIGFVFFVLVPYLVFSLIGYYIDSNYYLTILLFSFLFLTFSRNIEVKKIEVKNHAYKKYLIVFFISMILLILSNGYLFIFLSGWLILFLTRGMSKFDQGDFFKYILPYFLFFIIYSSFFWSGFGRLILAGNIIYPIFYWLKFSKINLKNIYIYISSIIVGCSLSVLRFTEEKLSLDVLLKDSSFGPFRRGHEIYENINLYDFNIHGFLDQLLLMIFAFVPRELWPEKPIGFGRFYVNREMDTSLFSDEHSIAALFSGEFFYFLQNYSFIAIILFLIFFISFLKLLSNKLYNLNHVALIYIPTFVWGGMASFGSRFSLVCCFLIVWLVIEKLTRLSLSNTR